MKQILQDLSTGETLLVEAPAPRVKPGHLLIDTTATLISTGTERMLVDFGRAGLISKARQQPEKVAQVVQKVGTDGLLTTIDAVRSKLSQPLPMGYCNVGVVREVGAGVEGFSIGDRVASNGAHADIVCVPKNLCAKIPDEVTDSAATFTVVASIGLQGIRLANPTLGETFAVIGVGLIGLLAVQMLRAQGCRVLAIDFDQAKLDLAAQFGAEICNPANGADPVKAGLAYSRMAGIDGVIITASTKSSDPVSQAAAMSRKRGRIIMVGVTGLELNRSDFYEKELIFQVSCSYGPGRYDPAYEEKGQDYPLGMVRWTEQRNFQAVLDLLASGQIATQQLISHQFDFAEATSAYNALGSEKQALGILLKYPHEVENRHIATVSLTDAAPTATSSGVTIGFAGAGNYASRVLIPAFKGSSAKLHTLCSTGGTSAAVHGKRAGFQYASSDTDKMIQSTDINTIVIATRHDSHAELAIKGLQAGKHIFVEKPLALTLPELQKVEAAHKVANTHLMVGFNRRFAPHVVKMKSLLDEVTEPKTFMTVMNAGAIPADHWVQDKLIGGGRIIGEACHHIDLLRFLADSPITSVTAKCIGGFSTDIPEDKAVIVLGFEDGSFGTIHYLANGGTAFPKERVEVFAGGATLHLDNFLTLRGYNWPGFKKMGSIRQDKGQRSCVDAFVQTLLNGGPTPIEPSQLFETSKITIDAATQLSE